MTLLIDIEHPEQAEALRLMCGADFEVLRVDATGLEVYGKAHQGKDYLFCPLAFRPAEAGFLAVHMPSEYEEWFMERGVDGARVVFSTPQGRACFPDMPEEYRSNAGYLRVGKDAALHVELDRLEPGTKDWSRPCEEEAAPGKDDTAPLSPCENAPAPETNASCACAAMHATVQGEHAEATAGQAAADRKLAAGIRAAAEELNALLNRAAQQGLLLRLSLDHDGQNAEHGGARVQINGIYRPL